jgi:hypothetical protein
MHTQALLQTAAAETVPALQVDIRFNGSLSFDNFMHLICDELKMPCRLLKLDIVYQGCRCLGELQLVLFGTSEAQQIFFARLQQHNLSYQKQKLVL